MLKRFFWLNQQLFPYLPRLVVEAVAVGAMALLVAFLTIHSENSSATAIPKIGLFAIVALRLMPSLSKLMSAVLYFVITKLL